MKTIIKSDTLQVELLITKQTIGQYYFIKMQLLIVCDDNDWQENSKHGDNNHNNNIISMPIYIISAYSRSTTFAHEDTVISTFQVWLEQSMTSPDSQSRSVAQFSSWSGSSMLNAALISNDNMVGSPISTAIIRLLTILVIAWSMSSVPNKWYILLCQLWVQRMSTNITAYCASCGSRKCQQRKQLTVPVAGPVQLVAW